MMIRKEKHIHQRIVVLVTRTEDEHKLCKTLEGLHMPIIYCLLYTSQVEERMIRAMVKLMLENDSPAEQFERLGLESYLPTP